MGYNGGMDVIPKSPQARDRLRTAYPDWLSARDGGR
jgi:hypothetical protein